MKSQENGMEGSLDCLETYPVSAITENTWKKGVPHLHTGGFRTLFHV